MESELDRGVFVDRTEGERTTIGELLNRYLVEIILGKKSANRELVRLKGLKRNLGAYSALYVAVTSLNIVTKGSRQGLPGQRWSKTPTVCRTLWRSPSKMEGWLIPSSRKARTSHRLRSERRGREATTLATIASGQS